MKAHDVMTSDVVSVSPQTPISEVAKILQSAHTPTRDLSGVCVPKSA